MNKRQSKNPELLAKVDEALKEERRRATGEFAEIIEGRDSIAITRSA